MFEAIFGSVRQALKSAERDIFFPLLLCAVDDVGRRGRLLSKTLIDIIPRVRQSGNEK
jgi:hypothetical protein